MAALGDIIYRGSSVWKRLIGNTATTRKVLCQAGTGGGSAAPTWEDVGFIQRATVTLTDAQIKALPTTPVTLLAAPGSGLRNKLIACTYIAKATSGAYTNINTTYSDLHVETPSGQYHVYHTVNDSTVGLEQLTKLLGLTASTVVDATVPALNTVEAGSTGGVGYVTGNGKVFPGAQTTDWDNVVLRVVIDNNGSGVLTGGHSANTLKFIVYYVVETL